jgi:outer membrane murein-binding lipoprotein Lpp
MTPIRADLHRSTAPSSGRVRPTTVAAAVATALGVFLAPEAMSQAASASDVQALKAEMQQLQRKIDQLEAQQAAAQSTPAPAKAAAPTGASTAPTLKAGPLTLTFGGFLALEGVYRNKNETADMGSNYNSAIPYAYQTNAHVTEFRESARQSRFSFLAQGPKLGGSITPEGYLETDFLSAGVSSNSAESNSYTLRMRNFYGVLRDTDAEWYLLAGQNWSLATLYGSAQLNPRSERIPQTIDAQYVAGFNWTRNAQLRFVKSVGKMFSAGISIESPQTAFYTGCNGVATPAPAGCAAPPSNITTNPGGSLLNSTANYSIDFAPDIIVKVAVDPGFGHYELYGLGRGFRDRSPGNASGTNNTTWAGSIGAGMILPLVPNVLELQASGLAGAGNGRYGSAQLPDATIRPDGTVAAIREWQALAGIVFKPIPDLTLYVYAGEEQASRTAYTNAAGTGAVGYGSALYNNSGCYSLAGTAGTCIANTRSVEQVTLGEWWKVYTGDIGNFQIGLQYSYLSRRAFSGVGGDPIANISMGFVSFRYYPYQK